MAGRGKHNFAISKRDFIAIRKCTLRARTDAGQQSETCECDMNSFGIAEVVGEGYRGGKGWRRGRSGACAC